MIRAASLLVFVGLAAFLFMADGASRSGLGAKQAGDFLELPTEGGDGRPLWRRAPRSSR